MAKAKTITSIRDLTPDSQNANRGTQRGGGMLEDSLQRYGAGRSVLADKHGNLIAGNKTVEGAASVGMNDVIVVPSDGTKLVVVQRTDIDLNTKRGRELALRDNRIAEVNLDWDSGVLAALADEGVELADLFSGDELEALVGADGATDELRDEYSPKVGEVVYEPKETKWKPSELFDPSAASQFEAEISAIENKDLQKLLRARASQMVAFNYSRVADYYAYQAKPEEKSLFEKLALVLLDRDQLIANGFAALIEGVKQENGFNDTEGEEERE